MTFDSARGQIINVVNPQETWTWDGTAWMRKSAAAPLGITPEAITDDTLRGVVLAFGVTDPGIDVWQWNGSDWSRLVAATPPPPARHRFSVAYDQARDNVVLFGGEGFVDTWTFNLSDRVVDTSPPATTASLSGTVGLNGWYRGPVTVTLVATGPDEPSDVAGTTYSLNRGPVTTYSGPFTVSGDGSYTLEFGSFDRAGNVEAPRRTLEFKIDAIAPIVTCTAVPKKLWPPNGKPVAVTVSGRIADPVSKIAGGALTYSVLDEYRQVQRRRKQLSRALNGTPAFSANGDYRFRLLLIAKRNGNDHDGRRYTIQVSASDNAGNVGSCSTSVVVPHGRSK
jgi:hypothetical protein